MEQQQQKLFCQRDTQILLIIIGTSVGLLLAGLGFIFGMSDYFSTPVTVVVAAPLTNTTIGAALVASSLELQITYAIGLFYTLAANETENLVYVNNDDCGSPLLTPFFDTSVNTTMEFVRCLWLLDADALKDGTLSATQCVLGSCGSSAFCVAACTPTLPPRISEAIRLFVGHVTDTVESTCLI